MSLGVIWSLTWCHWWCQGWSFSTTATAVDVCYRVHDHVPDRSRQGYFLWMRWSPSSSEFCYVFSSSCWGQYRPKCCCCVIELEFCIWVLWVYWGLLVDLQMSQQYLFVVVAPMWLDVRGAWALLRVLYHRMKLSTSSFQVQVVREWVWFDLLCWNNIVTTIFWQLEPPRNFNVVGVIKLWGLIRLWCSGSMYVHMYSHREGLLIWLYLLLLLVRMLKVLDDWA